jgi:Mg-chelatase subunit ChlD
MHALTRSISAVTLAVTLAAPAWAKAPDAPEAPETNSAKVDVVFVLDTTGSMGGLIQAAKEKIWAIANTLALADPAPDIRMGLVGYRDRQDDYITKSTRLTDDLDAVYTDLMTFEANGGNDTPESVNQALHEAVSKMQWRDSDDTYRVIFLVGDAPPHMDYEDDVKYSESCKHAAEAGIYVNTIQCGNIPETTPIWKEIAAKAEGRFFQVEQSGGAILTDTPFDDELAALGAKVEDTRCYYGAEEIVSTNEARLKRAGDIDLGATTKAKAQRALFNNESAGAKNFYGTQELVNDFTNGDVDVDSIDVDQLPEEFRGKSKSEIESALKEIATEREALQEKITELAKKRQAHIEDQLKKTALQGKGSLDFGIFDCIQTQAVKAGLEYKGGPAL